MKKINLLFVLLLGLGVALGGCNGDGDDEDTTTDPDVVDDRTDAVDDPVDDPVDDRTDPVDDPVEDTVPDTVEDVATDEEEENPVHPPCADPPPPEIGEECDSYTDCGGEYPRCFEEDIEEFDGETYISWLDGYCGLQGTGTLVCDIENPDETCPEGMRCMYLYGWGSAAVYGCMDACTSDIPDTDPPELYGFNCGCRASYECSITGGVCLPGCSHSRECCEVWRDDGDYVREEGEVEVLEGCTNYCDNDPSDDGGATYSCVNMGDLEAAFSDACLHDSQCPADGRCLDPIWNTDDDGNPNFPGGYCLKDRCDADGRGCGGSGQHCANLGTGDSPFWACVAACSLGDDPDGESFPCRQEPADEKMTCAPFYMDDPFLDTSDFDGYCWYGNFESEVADPNFGADCEAEADCWSPLGHGHCYTMTDFDVNFCSVGCNETLAVDHDVCGAAAEGICDLARSGICWPSCDDPGGPLGENGCPVTDPPAWACYATADFADDLAVADGATMPTGFCYPACEGDEDCTAFADTGWVCDTDSGVCSEE
ncbi:MAG: hypothetical protein ABIJ56_08690 [Pseudomonadota bacterium]